MSDDQSRGPSIEAVLGLARRFPVFPCRRTGSTVVVNGRTVERKPKSPLTQHGFEDASQDPDVICAWYDAYPGCLWGVPTGSTTRLVVIDYDTEKADEAARDWLTDHADDLMEARIHCTLSGGRHYLFESAGKYASGVSVTLDGSKRIGLDIRADGGYIVWWPLEGFAVTGDVPPLLPDGLLVERGIQPRELPTLPAATPESWLRNAPIAADVLAYHDPEDYDEWIGAGMSIHAASGGSQEGFALWSAFSAGELTGGMPKNYGGPEDLRYRWDSFSSDRPRAGIRGLGSLVQLAKQRGYVPRGTNGSGNGLDHVAAEHPSQIPNDPEAIPPAPISGSDIFFGDRLYHRSGNDLHYTVERGWLVWSGRHWQVDDKAVAVAAHAIDSARCLFDEIRESMDRDKAFKLAKEASKRRSIEAAIWLTRSQPGIYQELTTFDASPMILNCHNGIIDLQTGSLSPHSKDARCTLLAGTEYDPSATAPRWRQFIGEICLENTELMDYLQRVCGYLLTAHTTEHCLFFMHGGGRNGKSVMVDALMKVMGDYAGAAEPDMLMTRKHQGIPVDVAALRGKRAVFLNETNQGQRFDEAKLKNLTGGDRLQARFMRENLFEFNPTHKLVLRGNHKPTVNGTDEGIWSRLRLIPFDLRLSHEQLDRTLSERLHGELPGILAWCVDGCRMWLKDGLRTPAIIADALKEYRRESDTLGRFLEECCDTGNPTYEVKSAPLYRRYKEFCETGSERWLSFKDFPYEMEARGFRKVKKEAGARFIGCQLKVSADDRY